MGIGDPTAPAPPPPPSGAPPPSSASTLGSAGSGRIPSAWVRHSIIQKYMTLLFKSSITHFCSFVRPRSCVFLYSTCPFGLVVPF